MFLPFVGMLPYAPAASRRLLCLFVSVFFQTRHIWRGWQRPPHGTVSGPGQKQSGDCQRIQLATHTAHDNIESENVEIGTTNYTEFMPRNKT